MNNAALSMHSINSSEPIPGYFIKERIGAGGYGEVWRAEAPGGIAKAIKIVYGYLDDERASRELKSLNRIKEVRHPFLLSLDRIEIVDNHLLIVSELATSSLKDCYDECRQAGLPGLPRDELLMHLTDVADALDYICSNFSLQHLDIKPENLLLVGGRVKVADFGLVKELHDVESSFMGGLTPIYAPPEVFDGAPNRHSDQYSLAIVFQEMLTGVLPFQGRTTAQLAAQHLHSRPNLAGLPTADQPTIARALSKTPERRFPNCRALMDALRDPRQTPPRPAAPASTYGTDAPRQSPPSPKTEVLTGDTNGFNAAMRATLITGKAEPAPPVVDLPRIELDAAGKLRPTLFVGIGGLGGKTLQCLQRRLVDRFGDVSELPALQLLALDTDAEALHAVTSGDRRTALAHSAALALPLRQTADYRRDSDKHLQWMSRRWLYNIPRSLETKGFRPLGRLAFVDHADRVLERIKEMLVKACDPARRAATAEKLGTEISELPPRVFIVASINGGTGSGMVLDVAYAVRKILADLGHADDGVCGILAHGADRKQQSCELAMANAYACLNELYHYSQPATPYPGDAACGLPAFEPGDKTFHDTYLVRLGEELDDAQFAAATDTLAEYLYRNTASLTSEFFDKCRAAELASPDYGSTGVTLRTFGLNQLGFSYNDIPTLAAEDLCGTLIHQWRGVSEDAGPAKLSQPNALIGNQMAADASEADLRQRVESHAEAIGLDLEQLVAQVCGLAEQEMGSDCDAYLRGFLEEIVANYEPGRDGPPDGPTGTMILEKIDTIVGTGGAANGQVVSLEAALATHLEGLSTAKRRELRRWIVAQMDSSSIRVKGAQSAAETFSEYLQLLNKRIEECIRPPRIELAGLEQSLLSDNPRDRVELRYRGFGWRRRLSVDQRLLDYFRLRIQEASLCGVFRIIGTLQTEVTDTRTQLRDLWRDLNRLSDEFATSETPESNGETCAETPPDACTAVRAAITQTLRQNKTRHVRQLDALLIGELHRILDERLEVRKTLIGALRNSARAIVLQAVREINVAEIVFDTKVDPQQPLRALRAGFESAQPKLAECGGGRRVLMILPQSCGEAPWRARLADALPTPPTVVLDAENDIVVCCEDEQLPLPRVATALVDGRIDYIQLASRLHARVDVNWLPL